MDKFTLLAFGILFLLAMAIVIILAGDMTMANIFLWLFSYHG